MTVLRLACCLSLLAVSAVAAEDGQPTGELPVYDIKLDVDVENRSFSADVSLHLPPDPTAPSAVTFYLNAGLTLDLLTVNGQPASYDRPYDDREQKHQLQVTLPQEARGQAVDYRFRYSGGRDSVDGIPTFVIRERASEFPGRLMGWYPALRDAEAIQFTMTITFPEGQQFVHTGVTREVSTKDGQTVVQAASEKPVADIFVLLGNELRQDVTEFCGREYRLYYGLSDDVDPAQYLDDELAALRIIWAALGDPLGEGPIVHVLSPRIKVADGYRADNLVVENGSIQGDLCRKRHGGRYILLKTHARLHDADYLDLYQLTHLWLNQDLTDSWWISESFCQFFTLYANEVLLGEANARWLWRKSADIFFRRQATDLPIVEYGLRQDEDSPTDWRLHISRRGPWLVSMLRYVMGDARFFPMIREFYQQRGPDGRLTVAGLHQTANKYAAENLDWFFDQWIYGTVAVDYQVRQVDIEQTVEGYTTHITVGNAGAGRMPVEVELAGTDVALVKRIWLDSGDEQQITIDSTFEPVRVWIDPLRRIFEADLSNNIWPEPEPPPEPEPAPETELQTAPKPQEQTPHPDEGDIELEP